MAERSLLVTIDTEVDKDPRWRISNPVSFRSVTDGVPLVLSPLFDRYGVVPTYFLSAEVLEERECVTVLKALGDRAELGTHLHSEFVEPDRKLSRDNMAGQGADALQKECSRDIESRKLENLTTLFRDRIGYAPTSFRAGRYAISESTLEILARLGYRVDSSVTPGLRWEYLEGVVDFTSWSAAPVRVDTPAGPLVEIPVSIRTGSMSARWVQKWPAPLKRAVTRLAGRHAQHPWLRPSWASGSALIRYVKASREPIQNLMLHSMEVIPGASPYARTSADAERIVDAMDALFEYCASERFTFCGITAASSHV